MKKVFLVKYGEIGIKGKNRYIFENRLVNTIRKSLTELGEFTVHKHQGRVMIESASEEEAMQVDEALVIDRLSRVFGIVAIGVGHKEQTIDMDTVRSLAVKHIKEVYGDEPFTFKVETRRADKNFPLNSMEINADVGGYVLEHLKGQATVDVHQPEVLLMVELRNGVYVYSKTYKGCAGMPYGTNGRATLLLSGGIDSPVAGWMVAKRGVEIDAVYFESPPYTSERAKQKVVDLAKKIALYTGEINLHVVPFTNIQMAIYEKCPHEELTLIMRRLMMRIAERIAIKNKSMALITGESVGQVASQTMQSLVVTDHVVDMPVFRPLIGFDKEEIVAVSKKIDTYETSILPYEDCCTIFVPKHPQTKPKLDRIERSERLLEAALQEESGKGIEALLDEAIENMEIICV